MSTKIDSGFKLKQVNSRGIKKITNIVAFLFVVITPAIAIPRTVSLLIKDSPKEVIDQVWQIIYRDYLDSIGN